MEVTSKAPKGLRGTTPPSLTKIFIEKFHPIRVEFFIYAPPTGIEPVTWKLTASRSTY
jgi:hypothetical protein